MSDSSTTKGPNRFNTEAGGEVDFPLMISSFMAQWMEKKEIRTASGVANKFQVYLQNHLDAYEKILKSEEKNKDALAGIVEDLFERGWTPSRLRAATEEADPENPFRNPEDPEDPTKRWDKEPPHHPGANRQTVEGRD